jgi:RimJ/RimL family protein N-acetyltransferase
MHKILASIRNRGLRTTLTLIAVKTKAVLELFMPRTIWGDSVGLRPVKSSLKDAEIEQDYRWSRDEDIVRLWGGAPTELSLDEFRNQLRRERWHPQSDQRSFYVVTHAGELIGRIRLYSIDWTKGEGEMGVFLDKEHWGKQYGREALKLLEQYIFTETPINRIYLLTFKDNVRAQRSFIACGFRAVGVARRYLPSLGEYVEHVQMEITRQDFRDQRTSNRN